MSAGAFSGEACEHGHVGSEPMRIIDVDDEQDGQTVQHIVQDQIAPFEGAHTCPDDSGNHCRVHTLALSFQSSEVEHEPRLACGY